MSEITALVAANTLPELALPLIESASVQGGAGSANHAQLQAPSTQDSVTISPEASALQKRHD